MGSGLTNFSATCFSLGLLKNNSCLVFHCVTTPYINPSPIVEILGICSFSLLQTIVNLLIIPYYPPKRLNQFTFPSVSSVRGRGKGS